MARYLAVALLSLAWLFGGNIARAGTVTITISTASGACSSSCSKTYTDTDANLAKIVTTFQTQCNAKIAGTCTGLQVIQFWADSFIASTVAAVTGNDKSNLTNAATSGYVPINPQ